MDLKDFIKNSILEITNGILEAQEAVCERGATVCPTRFDPRTSKVSSANMEYIDFNVAVTATDESKVGGGIQVATLFKVGGDLKEVNSSVSSISFKVPILYPLNNSNLNN